MARHARPERQLEVPRAYIAADSIDAAAFGLGIEPDDGAASIGG